MSRNPLCDVGEESELTKKLALLGKRKRFVSFEKGSAPSRKKLPQGSDVDELPFRSIKDADSFVASTRTKVFGLKMEREMVLRQLSHINDEIVDADKKLEVAVKKRASFLRQMELDKKILAMLEGDHGKAADFKDQCGKMTIDLLELRLSKGHKMTKEEVFTIVQSSLRLESNDITEAESVNELIDSATSADVHRQSHDSQPMNSLDCETMSTSAEVCEPVSVGNVEEGCLNNAMD